jgi:GTP-dependent dephospho-CoA kinase
MRRFGGKDLRLPARLRVQMRDEAGRILQTNQLAEALAGAKAVVSVGDVCTETILGLGIEPKLAIVDGRTKRGPWSAKLGKRKFRKVKVRNPAEAITKEMWAAIGDAYGRAGSTLIVVDGEEDIASLACIFLAPEGTTVIYGVPNRGVMVIPVEAAIRSRTGAVLAEMEG